MTKVSVVVLADTETHEDLGRVANAFEYCAGSFGVKEAVKAAKVPLLGEFDGHPSLRSRITQGYQVITF